MQPTRTNVWAARFACLHGPIQEREREREREKGEREELDELFFEALANILEWNGDPPEALT